MRMDFEHIFQEDDIGFWFLCTCDLREVVYSQNLTNVSFAGGIGLGAPSKSPGYGLRGGMMHHLLAFTPGHFYGFAHPWDFRIFLIMRINSFFMVLEATFHVFLEAVLLYQLFYFFI